MAIVLGKETKKAKDNFNFSGQPFSTKLAKNIALIKSVSAEANADLKVLDKTIAQAIVLVCNEILNDKHLEQFVVDQYQGGAGTSMNMNANEVITGLAQKLLKNKIAVHPLDHVNRSQSTNDVVPSAAKITVLQLLDDLDQELDSYIKITKEKAQQFKNIKKSGRTHLQDAVPMTLGQEFSAHACAIEKDIARLNKTRANLYELNLGGTAIGTEINCPKGFRQSVIKKLAIATHYPLRSASNLIYSTQYCDQFLEVGSTLTILSSNLIKFLNDLRLLASGPNTGLNEINFAPVQNGSTIMPGKVNPVMAEALTQICFQVIGNYQTMLLSAQAGQLELNVMAPVLYKNLFESLELMTNGVHQFSKLGMNTITASPEKCKKWLQDNTTAQKTKFANEIGYDQAEKKKGG